ncbi:MAG: hypothetical protein AB8F78_18665 [Saprospiraceae bacterium]
MKQVAPPMMGWKQFESSELATAETSNLGGQILNAILGVAMTYATLFGVGYMLYGQMGAGGIRIAVAVACAAALWARVKK